jgi:hypothetical protein
VKKFEYVYFTIYNYCSQQSYFPGGLAVRLQSMYLLALSAGGWILFLQSLFLRFVRNVWFTSHPVAMLSALCVYLSVAFVFYRILIVNEHDQKIIDRVERKWNNNPNKRRDSMIAFLVAAAPYILMIGMKLFLRRA